MKISAFFEVKRSENGETAELAHDWRYNESNSRRDLLHYLSIKDGKYAK